MKPQHIYLPEQIMQEYEKLSQKTGIKKAELMRRALSEYLEKNQKEADQNN